MKPNYTQIFKNKDLNNEDCNNWKCFTLFPHCTQVQTSLKSSSPLPISIIPLPLPIHSVHCYQCVPTKLQILTLNILLRNFKLWPHWFLGSCSNFTLAYFPSYYPINLIFTTLNFLLTVSQMHLVHSHLCPSTCSLSGTLLLRLQKPSSNVTTSFMKPSWLPQTKFISPGPIFLQHC